MKVNYREGTWFAIPLRHGGFAVGLVARATRKGPLFLAYLFGPRRESIPAFADVSGLDSSSAIKVARVGDLYLVNGKWSVLGQLPDFQRSAWPFPDFVRSEEIARRSWIVRYADDDPGRVVAEVPVAFGGSSLEPDTLFGAGAMEVTLTRILGDS